MSSYTRLPMRKPCMCHAGLSNNYLRVGELAERMKDNLFKDHYLVRRFIGGIVHQVRGSHAAPTQNNSGLCMEEAMVIVSVSTYHLQRAWSVWTAFRSILLRLPHEWD